MATFTGITINGNLVSDPIGRAIGDTNHVWNFTFVKNGLDKGSKEKAALWIKVSYFAPADDEFMSKLKKGDCIVVSADFPYMFDEYTASYGRDKKGNYSFNLSLQAYGVGRGTYDTRKEAKTEEESTDDFSAPKEDKYLPQEPVESEGFRPPF